MQKNMLKIRKKLIDLMKSTKNNGKNALRYSKSHTEAEERKKFPEKTAKNANKSAKKQVTY